MTIPTILITPPWRDKVHRLKSPNFPESLDIAKLPSLYLNDSDTPLAIEYVTNFLGLLEKSDFKSWVTPLIDESFIALKNSFESQSLILFGKALFEQCGMTWLRYAWLYPLEDSEITQIRTFINQNKFDGGDTLACRAIIRALAVNYQFTSSQPALAELYFQQTKGKPRFRSLARQQITNLEYFTKLNYDELQDLTMPTFGFNTQGKQAWQLGEDSYELRLDNHCHLDIYQDKVLIKTLPRLPKTANKDQWQAQISYQKTLSKQLDKLYKTYLPKLESEFRHQTQRRIEHFRDNYLTHPILSRFAQSLVWALMDSETLRPKFVSAFIVNNDGSWLNSQYEDIQTLLFQHERAKHFSIVPLHPVFISQAEQDAFAQMLQDFEIIQPYPQMDLIVQRLTEREKATGMIERVQGDISTEKFYQLNKCQPYEYLYYGTTYSIRGIVIKNHSYYSDIEILFDQLVERSQSTKTYSIKPIVLPPNPSPIVINDILVNFL